ncbi:Sodium/calcium antiporter [Fulvivirga imtechensis AK7]|uniref:Sodium/calcium antiporter n=1 Tax=Fulvivirga imtechensis AK7 TaxID=1237149 RepID=L8JQK7_9BACT|nr:sodium:calcium antiporter [Fulvivirga imtechensis]ELR70508.1 Sodium/calcium antiporter [Fulvivirga imtechensis AK7]
MSLILSIVVFAASAIVIAFAGTRLARAADELADLTGWGEAVFGAVFLGGTTSLPGIITSVVAAYQDHPQLAISNAIGGIAAQTVFLVVADISYPKINLEHAAASLANLMQGLLLIGLLAIVLVGISGPEISVFNVNPLSILLVVLYIAGTRMIAKARNRPMWRPRETKATVKDEQDQESIKRLNKKKVIVKFAILAIAVAVCGYTIAKSGIVIAGKTGLSESFVGAFFTAVATSLPELIVSIAAVRQKALTLAVGNIIGGNTFDVLFVAFADVAYTKGSILHAIANEQVYIIGLTILMTSTLILGLLHREEKGIGKIGWESFMIILLYLAGNAFLFFL